MVTNKRIEKRWHMRRFSVSYGQDYFQIELYTEPIWGIALENAWDLFTTLLGEPCCAAYRSGRRTWMGVLYDLIPGEDNWLHDLHAHVQMTFLNNWFNSVGWKHHVSLLRVPITPDQAATFDPEFAAEMRDIFGDNIATPAATTTTYTGGTNIVQMFTGQFGGAL